MLHQLILSSSFLLFFSAGYAQGVNVKIIEGFKKGNATLIRPFMATEVELVTPHKEGTFPAAMGEKRINEFFRAYPPKDFSLKHSGKSPSGAKYSICILQTDRGTFRVYLLFGAQKDDEIHAIRIESDE